MNLYNKQKSTNNKKKSTNNKKKSITYLGVYDEQNTPILVEFSRTTPDKIIRETGIFDRLKREDIVDKSDKAITKAMDTIKLMSQRVDTTIKGLPNLPQHVEIEFGMKFDGELGVVIAKVSMEASIAVKLTWDR